MSAKLEQDLLIYPIGDSFRVIGEIDRDTLHEAGDAADTIQWAIDQLEDGGSIRLSRGDYPLTKPVRMRTNVMLCGNGRGSRLLVARASEAGIIVERAKGVTISDLTVQADGDGDDDHASRATVGLDLVTAGDCQVKGVLAQGFAKHGIRVRDWSMLCRVIDCSLADNAVSNLKFEQLTRGPLGDWIPNTAIGCTTYGGGIGVEVEHSIVLTLNGIQVHQSNGPAFLVRERSNAVSIVGCRTFQIEGDAVIFDDSFEVHIVGNVFSWHTKAGIIIRGCYWGTVTGNNVIDTGSYNPVSAFDGTKFKDLDEFPPSYPGIVLERSRGFTVTGNAIFQWPVVPPMSDGIVEDQASADNVISSNNINFYRNHAVNHQGQQTQVAANVGYGPVPLHNNPPTDRRPELFIQEDHIIQGFQPELTQHFIDQGYKGAPDGPAQKTD